MAVDNSFNGFWSFFEISLLEGYLDFMISELEDEIFSLLWLLGFISSFVDSFFSFH
jgi:hypothetical protein